MRWCRRCLLPDTRPGIRIGADGICLACATHGVRPEIDWKERERLLHALVDEARGLGRDHDCLIPVSGGKDSIWQVVVCLELGLRPLCVTWRPPGRNSLGERNLRALINLGVDHIDMTVNPAIERRFMLKTLEKVGDPAVPMHLAIYGIPLRLAARFGIPLVIWGENSAVEYAGLSADGSARLDASWVRDHGATRGTLAEDWADEELTARDLASYRVPTADELSSGGVRSIFLGSFIPWDPERSRDTAMARGFTPRTEGPRTGLYDYADIDDDFISVHHWFKWYKFGCTRLFENLSLEIRNGRLDRATAIEIARSRGDDTPHGDIDALRAFLGISVERFQSIAERFRNPDVWRREDGVWKIPDFLIPDWKWSA